MIRLDVTLEGDNVVALIQCVDRLRASLVSYGVERNAGEKIGRLQIVGTRVAVEGPRLGKGVEALMTAAAVRVGAPRRDPYAVVRGFRANFRRPKSVRKAV
jgi:hypothetical protein